MTPGRKRATVVGGAAVAVAAAVSAATVSLLGSGTLTGTINKTYSKSQCATGNGAACWTCKQKTALHALRITVDTNASRVDAVKLAAGCTGTIGELTVVTSSGDAVKVAEGVHDLTIGSGSIRCLDKAPVVHQDGVQVMGGQRITFRHLRIDCGRAGVPLIDSNLFVNMAGTSTSPPEDIVCDGCWLGPNAAHTMNLQASLRSGLRNTTVCPGKFPKLSFTVGAAAVQPVDAGNLRPAAC